MSFTCVTAGECVKNIQRLLTCKVDFLGSRAIDFLILMLNIIVLRVFAAFTSLWCKTCMRCILEDRVTLNQLVTLVGITDYAFMMSEPLIIILLTYNKALTPVALLAFKVSLRAALTGRNGLVCVRSTKLGFVCAQGLRKHDKSCQAYHQTWKSLMLWFKITKE